MNIKDYPLVLKPKHVAEILGVTERTAYNYMSMKGFPSFKMPGKRGSRRVYRDSFFAWMMEQGESEGA